MCNLVSAIVLLSNLAFCVDCYMNYVSNSKEMLSEQKNLSNKKNLQSSSLFNYCFKMVVAMEMISTTIGVDTVANKIGKSC